MRVNIDDVVSEALKHSTMRGLAKRFEITPTMLRYSLCRARKLSLVDSITDNNKREKKNAKLQKNIKAISTDNNLSNSCQSIDIGHC
jgi:hypothetical protein